MENNRTRTFKASYTHKDGNTYSLKVRINPRLVSLFLALTLVSSTTACSFAKKDKSEDAKKALEQTSRDKDLETIKEIIETNKDMTELHERIIHEVEAEQTLSDIALMYGTTVDELMKLNKGKLGPKGGVFMGSNLTVDAKIKLSDEDAKINILEAYFDYVLNKSTTSGISHDESVSEEQRKLYSSLLYGFKKDNNTLDPNSIEGHYKRAYMAYHSDDYDKPIKTKSDYINTLLNITVEVEETLKDIAPIVSYTEFEMYCLNKSIDYSEPIERTYTPYGDMINKNKM